MEYVATNWDLTGGVLENLSPFEAVSIPFPFSTAVRVASHVNEQLGADGSRCLGPSSVYQDETAPVPIEGNKE